MAIQLLYFSYPYCTRQFCMEFVFLVWSDACHSLIFRQMHSIDLLQCVCSCYDICAFLPTFLVQDFKLALLSLRGFCVILLTCCLTTKLNIMQMTISCFQNAAVSRTDCGSHIVNSSLLEALLHQDFRTLRSVLIKWLWRTAIRYAIKSIKDIVFIQFAKSLPL